MLRYLPYLISLALLLGTTHAHALLDSAQHAFNERRNLCGEKYGFKIDELKLIGSTEFKDRTDGTKSESHEVSLGHRYTTQCSLSARPILEDLSFSFGGKIYHKSSLTEQSDTRERRETRGVEIFNLQYNGWLKRVKGSDENDKSVRGLAPHIFAKYEELRGYSQDAAGIRTGKDEDAFVRGAGIRFETGWPVTLRLTVARAYDKVGSNKNKVYDEQKATLELDLVAMWKKARS